MEKSWRLIWWAIGLSFVSQFLPYKVDGGGMLTRATDERYYTGLVLFGDMGGTGWQKHGLALPLLAALAYIYWSSVHDRPFWRRWGHWMALVMLWLCTIPADIVATSGGFLGGVAMALAIWSLVLRRREIAAAAIGAFAPPSAPVAVALADEPPNVVAPPLSRRQKAAKPAKEPKSE